jgi:hypothetical protein
MFQESEIINLILSVASPLFFAGFELIPAARLFTVVEGVFRNSFFNHPEHLCHGLSGLFSAGGCFRLPPAWKNGLEA